ILDGLRGLVDLDQLLEQLVVGVPGLRGEDVHVRQGVRVGGVIGGDGVGELESGIRDKVVVDDRGGDVWQRGGGEGCLQCGDGDLRLGCVDVVEGGEDASAALEFNESSRLQHEEGAGQVAGVVRNSDGRAGRNVFDRVELGRVQGERVDRGGADRSEIFTRGLVVLGQVNDVLELVQVELTLSECRVRQFVAGEVDHVDGDPLSCGGLRV